MPVLGANSPFTFYLAGPTAVGKTDLAVALAERLGAEIVGCDAFQVYEGLPLLTAKPEPEALARVPHHLIGEIPLTRSFDVAQYRTLALERLQGIHRRGKGALVVGGTGMYLRALTRGLADLPPVNPQLREKLDSKPPEELLEELRRLDPVAFGQIDLKNPRRVVRAVEVCLLTGRPFSSFQGQWETPPENLRGILLERDKTVLYERINRRVEWMFRSGLLEEVASAGEIGPTAAQTLGLREVQGVLAGEVGQEEAIRSIQQATRHYAKRQATWFRREAWLTRLDLDEYEALDAQRQAALRLLSRDA